MSYGKSLYERSLIDRYFPLIFIAGFCPVLLLALPWIIIGYGHYLNWVGTFK